MVLNKKQAMEILTNHSPSASFLANVVAHQPQYRGKAAKYLKFAACLVSHGFDVVLAPFSISQVQVNFQTQTWRTVELVGEALYKGRITADQARRLFNDYA